ncbi:MAG TPA: hypothetical protein VF185_04870 [Patescibacteria group bacterium]
MKSERNNENGNSFSSITSAVVYTLEALQKEAKPTIAEKIKRKTKYQKAIENLQDGGWEEAEKLIEDEMEKTADSLNGSINYIKLTHPHSNNQQIIEDSMKTPLGVKFTYFVELSALISRHNPQTKNEPHKRTNEEVLRNLQKLSERVWNKTQNK